MKGTRKKGKSGILQFLEERGFYIVLFLCVAAIGVSGYVLFFSDSALEEPPYYDMDLPPEEESPVQVAGDIELEIPDSIEQTEPPAQTTPEPPPETTKPAQTQPAKQVVKIEEPRPAPAAPVFVRPVSGAVVKAFSGDELVFDKTMNDWRVHKGADYAAEAGERVCAISSGTVTEVFYDELLGYSVRISHDGGLESLYCSLMESISVKAGQKVESGDVIGGVGNTMTAESEEESHLHLEVTKDGVAVDPETILPKKM